MRKCVWVGVFVFVWLTAASKLTAAEDAKPKEIVQPVKNGVRVYTSSRVLIGVIDKEAKVEVLQKAAQWCQVQYAKDGNHDKQLNQGKASLPFYKSPYNAP